MHGNLAPTPPGLCNENGDRCSLTKGKWRPVGPYYHRRFRQLLSGPVPKIPDRDWLKRLWLIASLPPFACCFSSSFSFFRRPLLRGPHPPPRFETDAVCNHFDPVRYTYRAHRPSIQTRIASVSSMEVSSSAAGTPTIRASDFAVVVPVSIPAGFVRREV